MSDLTTVQVKKLWDTSHWKRWDDHFKYSKYAERLACDWLAMKKQWIVESVISENADYDAIVSGKKIEVKFQSKKPLSIEYCTSDRRPSGIMITKSDFYLMINLGSSSLSGEWCTVGKVRLIPTATLQRIVFDKLEQGKDIVRYDGRPGACCVEIDPKTMVGLAGDGYIGDINYRYSSLDGVEYDFGELLSNTR